jgi:hypothetical protein
MMEGLFYLIAMLLFKACPNMPFLFSKSDPTPSPSLKGEGVNREQESGRQKQEMFIE